MFCSRLSLVGPVCVTFLLSCAKPLSVYRYLWSLLFSLGAEPPSLWTNTFQKASAPPQNHFYQRPRQCTLTKGLKRYTQARAAAHVCLNTGVQFTWTLKVPCMGQCVKVVISCFFMTCMYVSEQASKVKPHTASEYLVGLISF